MHGMKHDVSLIRNIPTKAHTKNETARAVKKRNAPYLVQEHTKLKKVDVEYNFTSGKSI